MSRDTEMNPNGKESIMDDSTPFGAEITVPFTWVEALVMNDVIESGKAISEGLLVGFEACDDSGHPLNDIQKAEVMQAVFFCTRNLEQEMKANARMMFNLCAVSKEALA